jgi:hypothetical protein
MMDFRRRRPEWQRKGSIQGVRDVRKCCPEPSDAERTPAKKKMNLRPPRTAAPIPENKGISSVQKKEYDSIAREKKGSTQNNCCREMPLP